MYPYTYMELMNGVCLLFVIIRSAGTAFQFFPTSSLPQLVTLTLIVSHENHPPDAERKTVCFSQIFHMAPVLLCILSIH